MKISRLFLLAFTALAALPASTPSNAQERAKPTAEQKAASDTMWAAVKAAPEVPMERVILHPAVKLEGISAITSDKQGNIYVIHRPTAPDGDPVVVVDSKGTFLRSWGKGMYVIPHGIRIDPAGNVWTLDANTSKVYKFTPEGKKLLEIDIGDIPDLTRPFCGITDIAFSPTGNGDVYIGDGYCNARVLEYDANGKKVREWGKHGTGPGEFNLVHGVAIGPDGNLYIADRQNGRIQKFDLTGKFLGELKYGGEIASIAFGPNGELYAAMHPKGVPLDNDNTIAKIDYKTGKIIGRIESRSHELAVGQDGSVMPATRDGDLTIYRPKK